MKSARFGLVVCVLWSGLSLAAAPSVDGTMLPEMTEVTYSILCNGARSTLAYKERRVEPANLTSPKKSLRVDLARIEFSDRKLSDRGIALIRNVLQEYGWIDDVHHACDSGAMLIQIRGMPLNPWMAYVQDRNRGRPELVTRTIRVEPSGDVSVVKGLR